jgi:ABC-2 type transport system permease protein
MFNLFRRLAARHAMFVLICTLIFTAFEFLICGLVSTIDVSAVLQEVRKYAPPVMQSMLGEEFFGNLTSRGLLAFGWNHPIALSLGAAIAIVLASRAIAGEIESGMMELVLSQPVSRMKYLLSHVGFASAALLALSLGGAAGTMAGQNFYGLRVFESSAVLKLAMNYFLLQFSWFALTLALSVFGREGGRVSGAAFLIALMSYIFQVIGKLLPSAAFVLPYSLYNYYSPQAILVESKSGVGSFSVLFAFSALCLGFAMWRFERRDIP